MASNTQQEPANGPLRKTFIITVVGAAVFIGVVFVFILFAEV